MNDKMKNERRIIELIVISTNKQNKKKKNLNY